MLDEYCATVQVSRKHAIARIGRAIKALADEAAGVSRTPRQRTGRPSLYAADPHLCAAIHTIWETAKRPCGKWRGSKKRTPWNDDMKLKSNLISF